MQTPYHYKPFHPHSSSLLSSTNTNLSENGFEEFFQHGVAFLFGRGQVLKIFVVQNQIFPSPIRPFSPSVSLILFPLPYLSKDGLEEFLQHGVAFLLGGGQVVEVVLSDFEGHEVDVLEGGAELRQTVHEIVSLLLVQKVHDLQRRGQKITNRIKFAARELYCRISRYPTVDLRQYYFRPTLMFALFSRSQLTFNFLTSVDSDLQARITILLCTIKNCLESFLRFLQSLQVK